MSVDQIRLQIWMYKLMLGTLSKDKKAILRKELAKRYMANKTGSSLEMKVYTALTVKRDTRKYLATLLDDWEKRTYRD